MVNLFVMLNYIAPATKFFFTFLHRKIISYIPSMNLFSEYFHHPFHILIINRSRPAWGTTAKRLVRIFLCLQVEKFH